MDYKEREIVMSYLEHEREVWLPLHRRAERSAGMNAEANAEEAVAMMRIDRLLDELNALGDVAIRGTQDA
jgi:hypothetical protein